MVSFVGLEDCDAMAMMGHISVILTARPRKINSPHTCWMNRFPFLSKSGAVEFCVAYCLLEPYRIGVIRNVKIIFLRLGILELFLLFCHVAGY